MIYPTSDQLKNDILRKDISTSKNLLAMDTSKMAFISVENFTHQYDEPILFDYKKKIIGYDALFAEKISK